MIIDNPNLNLFAITNLAVLFKGLYIVLAVLYFVFALIVVRQVSLMTETVITEAGSLLRVLSIIHAIFALAIVAMFIVFF